MQVVGTARKSVHVSPAAAGSDRQNRLGCKGMQADVVPRSLCDPRDRKRRGQSIVELALQADARRHQTSAVEGHDDLLTALDLMLCDHQAPAPSARLPIDVSKSIARTVVAQALELAAHPAQAQLAQPVVEERAAPREPAISLDRL